jgi:coenzyme F420 biosynthesis associated uncharacterized protein
VTDTVALETGRPPDPVDWNTARRVARRFAGRDPLANSYLRASLEADFAEVTSEAEQLVSDFTHLAAPGRARAGVVDRAAWIDANIDSMRRLLEPIIGRLGARMNATPFAPVGKHAAGGEMGVLLGYMSQRVLGQYDLLVPEETDTGDFVYYVGPNVLSLEKRFAFRPRDFRRWIAIHELTHRAQFTAVPWMRGHFMTLVERSLGMVEPDPRVFVRAVARAAESLSRGKNPFDEAGLLGLFASEEQRAVLSEVQALMSLLEGHGNFVMNELGRAHVQGVDRMERVLQARRNTRGIGGQLQKMMGIEMKLRQYALGESFVNKVVERGGLAAVDAAWTSPESLPTLAELHDPELWLARMAGTRRR